MAKQYVILDFDECLFEHPNKDFLLHLEECFALSAIEHGFCHGNDHETYSKAIEISRVAYETVGESYTAFTEYGIDPHDVFNTGYSIFLERFLPEYTDQIDGSDYKAILQDPRFEVAILTHGSTEYASTILTHMGLEGLIDEERIIGLDKTDLALKSTSRKGFEVALDKLGLDPEQVEKEKPKNVFFADDAQRNLIIPHEMGIRTIHIGERCYESVGKAFVDFVFPRLKDFFDTFSRPSLITRLAYRL